MSGTTEQNTTLLPFTIAAAASTSTAMSQLQSKSYSQTCVPVATSFTTDWMIATGIILPKVSGVYCLSVYGVPGGVKANLTVFFTIQVLNTQMNVNAFLGWNQGVTMSYFLVDAATSTSSGAYTAFNNNIALSSNWNIMINGQSGRSPSSYTITVSRMG
jgi:hypothetical protein